MFFLQATVTIDLDPFDDQNGHVDVISIRLAGNVEVVDLAFKLDDDSGPWEMIYNIDATKIIVIPRSSR